MTDDSTLVLYFPKANVTELGEYVAVDTKLTFNEWVLTLARFQAEERPEGKMLGVRTE